VNLNWHLDWPQFSRVGDWLFLAGVVAFLILPFLIYLGLLWAGAAVLPPSKPRGAGRRLLGPLFIGYYYWLLGPVFRWVGGSGLRPNQITVASLVVAALTGVAIASGHFALGSVLLIASATLDIVDGQLARAKGMSTAGGAFLDSTVDRICDGLIFGGCAVYYTGTPMMMVSLVVLVMSFTVSYARSRAETLGITGAEGLMQRAERIFILGAGLAFSPFFGHRAEGFVRHPFYAVTAGALGLLAVFNTVTAISRITWTMRQLTRGRRPAPAPAPALRGESRAAAAAIPMGAPKSAPRSAVSALQGEATPLA
jgi:CDP-diacylglycerol--glycerol-3-phosphate 3-phosphatidyltransferase